MKKILFVIAILSALLFSFSVGAWADSIPKSTEVTFSDVPAVIKAGETIEITAVSVKHGSAYTDRWDNAEEISSVFDPATGTYISRASFTAQKSGTYKICYTVQMTAGKSNTVFSSETERTVEVISPVTLAGVLVKDLTVKPVYRTDGSLYAYSASGRVYALWSDNTATPSGSIFFYFGPDETSKSISATVYADGKAYTYKVAVTR